MFNQDKKAKVIKQLNSLKNDIPNLYKGNALTFGAKTLELIKKSVGENSEQYRNMETLLYDATALKMRGQTMSSDSLLVGRVKENQNEYIGIIDSCIEFINDFGLYKTPSERKNILGDFDNKTIWSILSGIAVTSFLLGEGSCKYVIKDSLSKVFSPSQEVPPKKTSEQQAFDTLKKNHTKSTSIKE